MTPPQIVTELPGELDPAAVLAGLAMLHERAGTPPPCLLGGDLALRGAKSRPFFLIADTPEAVLDLGDRAGDDSRFPWQPDAPPLLARIERFVGESGSFSTVELPGGPVPFGAGVTVGWIGHELSASRLVRHRAVLFVDVERRRSHWLAADAATAAEGAHRMVEAAALGARMLRATAGDEPPGFASGRLEDWIPTGPSSYAAKVREIKARIAAGDVYQVNLSHPIAIPLASAGPAALGRLFARLLARNPVPFPSFLMLGDVGLLALSPERYAARRGEVVESRPIKGTRPRGAGRAEDRRLAAELTRSPKDRAENVMIVDLVRNDLGRVARSGTVEVRGLCEVESFASVHHLVSTVRARLRPDVGLGELLEALHPAGSMTGAPKIRAVEILTALESEPRGPYAGGVGWFAGPSCFDLSMVIRSLVVQRGRALLRVGGGVVADSDPVAEYRETLDKGRSLLAVLRGAARVETAPGP